MFDISNLTPEERVTRAKIQMYQKSPFFAFILLNMKVIEDVDGKIFPPDNRTMAVDANGNLYWCREFVESISESELMGVIAHECLHIALMHLERGERKNKRLFNIANDLIVNDILIRDNFVLPKTGLIPEPWSHEFTILGHTITKIDEKSSEEIYDELYPLVPKIEVCMSSSGEGGDGKGDNQGLSQKEIEETREKLKELDEHIYGSQKNDGEESSDHSATDRINNWKKIIAEAAQLARQQGRLPAGLERRIDGILDSKMNWKQRLYKYVVAQQIFDYSWSTPHKRGAGTGIYLPNVKRESVHIVTSIDTSGSISQEDLKEFTSELIAIGNSFPNIKLDIIICDAEIHETYELTKDNVDDILSMVMSGGGGTSHKPVYNYVLEKINDAKVLINFTDGFTDFPENYAEIPFETVWVICKNGVGEKDIPFGEVIKIE